MAEVALQLIPWVEQKLKVSCHWLAGKYDLKTRLQAYQQLMKWTQSSLKISTLYDWGHTCDFAEAIDASAKAVVSDDVWAFTSRTLFNKATNRNIDSAMWQTFINRMVAFEIDNIDERLENAVKEFISPEAISEYYDSDNDNCSNISLEWLAQRIIYDWQIFSGKKKSENYKLLCQWMGGGDKQMFKKICSKPIYLTDLTEQDKIELEKGGLMLEMIEDICHLCNGLVRLSRCCEKKQFSRRKRALRVNDCAGVKIEADNARVPLPDIFSTWQGVKERWVNFLRRWPEITKKASKSFQFPENSEINQLLLHDMATGYVASTRMLRVGAQYTGRDGTTIIHPGERAAIVSLDRKVVSLEGSALNKHWIDRPYDEDAEEFARYALLRCDLVHKDRMNLKDALLDWYNKDRGVEWDRVPQRFSKWHYSAPKSLGEDDDLKPTIDDTRLVLLRQSLISTKPNVELFLKVGVEGSAFGGYIEPEPASQGNTLCPERTMVIDRQLQLTTTARRYSEIMDRWGYKHQHTTKTSHGWHCKLIEKTGMPETYRIHGTFSEQIDNEKPTKSRYFCRWFA